MKMMIMTSTKWILAVLLAATLPLPAPAALPTRTDINPALLYWQAFSLFPNLDQDERKEFLAERPTLPQPEGERLAAKYDGAFKLLHRAARMRVSCDWGIDLSDGPHALIPNLVKIRQTVSAAEARAHYSLEAERPLDAVEDLAAVLVLGRNSGTDGTLVSTMVGLAVEVRVVTFIAGNFDRFSAESLRRVIDRLDAAPSRPTVRQAMDTERVAFLGWFISRVEEIQAAHPDNNSEAMAKVRELFQSAFDIKGRALDGMVEDSGHTAAGVVAYLKQLEPIYDEITKVAGSAPVDLEREMAATQQLISRHTNHLAQIVFPNIAKARKTELGLVMRFAMLRAALALRLEGQAGFRKVQDPFGSGPFTLRGLPADSGRSGFELESELSRHQANASLRFTGSVEAEARP